MVKPIIKKSVCKNHKNECECCHIEFSPSPRLGARQKTCGAILCKKHHRAKYRRHYRKENAAIEKEYRSKRPTGYWREYRSGHPNYVNKNRFMNRMAQRVRRAGLQRQLDRYGRRKHVRSAGNEGVNDEKNGPFFFLD